MILCRANLIMSILHYQKGNKAVYHKKTSQAVLSLRGSLRYVILHIHFSAGLFPTVLFVTNLYFFCRKSGIFKVFSSTLLLKSAGLWIPVKGLVGIPWFKFGITGVPVFMPVNGLD